MSSTRHGVATRYSQYLPRGPRLLRPYIRARVLPRHAGPAIAVSPSEIVARITRSHGRAPSRADSDLSEILMIDISIESLLTLREAAAQLHGRPHISTIARWVSRGVRGVHLETVRIGGRTYTSTEALSRFAAACSQSSSAGTVARTAFRREADIARAERELNGGGQ